MNDDPSDDLSETTIKFIMVCGAVLMAITAVAIVLALGGCTYMRDDAVKSYDINCSKCKVFIRYDLIDKEHELYPR